MHHSLHETHASGPDISPMDYNPQHHQPYYAPPREQNLYDGHGYGDDSGEGAQRSAPTYLQYSPVSPIEMGMPTGGLKVANRTSEDSEDWTRGTQRALNRMDLGR